MTNSTEHKTLPGGSIDYGYYQRKARAIRSQDAHRNLKTCASLVHGFELEPGFFSRMLPSQPFAIFRLALPSAASMVRGLFSSPKV